MSRERCILVIIDTSAWHPALALGRTRRLYGFPQHILNPLPRVVTVLTLMGVLSTCRAPAAAWHPVSVTETFVYASPERLTVRLRVFLEDLYLFHELEPAVAEFLDPAAIERGLKLHEKFLRQRFVIRDIDGTQLDGRLVAIDRSDVPAEGVPLSDLMAHRVTFELEYNVASPEFLTFSHQFTDEEGMLPSEMRLSVKPENSEEAHTVLLRPGDVETVRFDWSLPPLPAAASRAQREAWEKRQKEQTLGITSYGSVYSFLYIEDHEVRHEILIPLLTLERSVLIARDADDMFDLAEQDAARQQIAAYFRSGNPVEIDGRRASAMVERCDFYGLDFRDFAMRADPKPVPIVTARVGIILSYPTDQPPRSVQVTWNRFNQFVWSVRTVVYAFEEEIQAELSRLERRNVFHWTGPARSLPAPPEPVRVDRVDVPKLRLPVVSLASLLGGLVATGLSWLRGGTWKRGILGFGPFLLVAAIAWPYAHWSILAPTRPAKGLASEEAYAVFSQLHRNLYQAFDYRDESDIYDVLAVSTSGDLLRDVYLQIRQGLVMAEQGGAVARVEKVALVSGQAVRGDNPLAGGHEAFAYRCRWNVSGTVEHWGHVHQRTNQYEAIFHVEDIGGIWKVTQMELLDEQRLEFNTRLRGL